MRVKFQNQDKLKQCPICGSFPLLDVESLDRGNGHGYPNFHSFAYYCPKCSLLESSGFIDSDSEEAAQDKALQNWNKLCTEVEKYLEWRNK